MRNITKTPRKTKAPETVAPVTETAAPETVAETQAETVAPVAPAETQAEAKPAYRTAARDAATVAAGRTFFAQYSDRDSAYLAFFGTVMRANNDTATLAQIHDAGTDTGNGKRVNPFYTGSAKATDAGAINRLAKAGYITKSESGNTLFATDKAKSTALYLGTKQA